MYIFKTRIEAVSCVSGSIPQTIVIKTFNWFATVVH